MIQLVWRAKKARRPPAVFGRIPTWKTNKTRRLPGRPRERIPRLHGRGLPLRRTASGARSPASGSGCARRRTPSPKPQTFRRRSSFRALPSSSTSTTDSRFGRETPKTTSRNALQPLSMRVRRIPSLKKRVNSRARSGFWIDFGRDGARPSRWPGHLF